MKLAPTFIILLFIAFSSYAQGVYETGYFIDNKGKKKECLIKNISWKKNPTEFEWKRSISSAPKTETIKNIKEFGVGKEFLFKRFSIQFGNKSVSRKTKTTKKTVFLRVLIKSKASLYQYSSNNNNNLLFYYTNSKNKIPILLVNNKKKKTFQKQLKKNINCKNKNTSRLLYTQKSLKKYFKKYNKCKGYKIKYSSLKKINQPKIGIIGGADLTNFSHPSVIPNSENTEIVYEPIYSPRYGMYAEAYIPFSKVDLSFMLEATYKSFSTEGIDTVISNLTYTLDYNAINIAFAPRFHLYLSPSFELYIEGGVNAAFDIGIESTNALAKDEIQQISSSYFYGGGLGIGIFKIGYRQYTSTNFSKSTTIPNIKLSASSLYISLNIF